MELLPFPTSLNQRWPLDSKDGCEPPRPAPINGFPTQPRGEGAGDWMKSGQSSSVSKCWPHMLCSLLRKREWSSFCYHLQASINWKVGHCAALMANTFQSRDDNECLLLTSDYPRENQSLSVCWSRENLQNKNLLMIGSTRWSLPVEPLTIINQEFWWLLRTLSPKGM